MTRNGQGHGFSPAASEEYSPVKVFILARWDLRQTSNPQNCKTTNLCCLIHQVWDNLSPVAQTVKNLPINAWDAGDTGSIPGLGRSPGGGHYTLLWRSYLENPHGQRSLEGYSPRGRKELDTTEGVTPPRQSATENQGSHPHCALERKTGMVPFGFLLKEIKPTFLPTLQV